VIEKAAEALGSFWLGPMAEELRQAEQVIFVPDGPLHLLPLEALRLPGPGGAEAEWIGARRVVARAPSATLLAFARERAAQSPLDATFRGLVMTGDRAGHRARLRGAEGEARDLVSRYSGLERWQARQDSAGSDPARRLLPYDLLHIAAHTELNDQYPWRSCVLLTTGDSGRGEFRIRADQIAGLHLRAGLAVLSGCESAGGRMLHGEGVQGLSSAFVAAGVPSMIATLWPVDDAATAQFMARLYEELADGKPVGEALRAARNWMAGSTAYAAPFYWAGFVLVGEASTRVALRKRPDPVRLLATGGLGLGLLGLGARVARRADRRRNRSAACDSAPREATQG